MDPHGSPLGPSVKEEEVAPRPGMLNRVLDEVNDGVTLEVVEAAETEVA